MCVGQKKSGPSLPILQKTSLGWIVTGKYNQSKGYTDNSDCHLSTAIVRKFWELEELPNESIKIYSEEQQQCEDEFRNSIRRLASGRYVVSLPFKSDTRLLGFSIEVAKRRFLSSERRLFKDDGMRQMYHERVF